MQASPCRMPCHRVHLFSDMQPTDIDQVMAVVREECRNWVTPAVTVISERDRNPFTVLVSCIISLRTKDAVTAAASARLFAKAATPTSMARLSVDEIAALIYPAGFYRSKASQIHELAARLVDEYANRVPDTVEELLRFKGVGRKTANLVVTLGYGKPGICVDIHVHRITNRWGYVATRTPEQTEMALRAALPQQYWIPINDLLVCYGQNRCFPVSPACSVCRLTPWCERRGVTRSR